MVLVVGPSWTASGSSVLDAGRFPLGVEAATLASAARLVPAVTSITAHARYFALHAAVAARAAKDGVTNIQEVVGRVRRAEVVLGGLSVVHADDSPNEHHGPAELGEPHGARMITPLLANGVLDVEDASERYSRQLRGFLTAYRGSEIALGLLDSAPGSLAPGPVQLSAEASRALDPVLELSRWPTLKRSQLADAARRGSCFCAVRSSADGRELRTLMFGGPEATSVPVEVRRARTGTALSARLLVQALSGGTAGAESAMAALCCFSDLDVMPADEQLRDWAMRWRGALLRNRSVTAWRWLWWWLTNELVLQPRTAGKLGDALAESLVAEAGGDRPTRTALTADLPERRAGLLLRDAEHEVLYPDGEASWQPLDYLRCLALGALRLDDLTGPALRTFTEHAEYGPRWVQGWLNSLGDTPLSVVGRDLAGMLLRQAEALSHSKARWQDGQLRLPTRLRPVGDVLYLAGHEGADPAGLRLGRLAEILTELDFLRRTGNQWHRGPSAIERAW